MTVLIVDDEPKAIDLIVNYLSHFPMIDITGTFRNGIKALDFLRTHEVDVIFLDINMPHLSGLALSKLVHNQVRIVFTTAYSEHAVESYEVSATDYLLKPISFERFTQTMEKILQQDRTQSLPKDPDSIFVRSGTRTHKIPVDEILYLEKDGNYITYYYADKKVVARESIAEALTKLPSHFRQSHKSFIVNLHHLASYEKDQLLIGATSIPIGNTFRKALINSLET